MTELPKLSLSPQARLGQIRGAPWIFSNQIKMTAEATALPAGSLVKIVEPQGRIIGLYHFNPHSLIGARLLSRNHDREIDVNFFIDRIGRALRLRERVIGGEHYRLVHAEGDTLPGLIIDRYGDTMVIQPNTAGMMAHLDLIISAIDKLMAPARIAISADGRARALEGLEPISYWHRGETSEAIPIVENGILFQADPLGGQKTGWFYDHRQNRAYAASLAKNQTVLDLYSYTGGFGITCAAAGAAQVVSVDSSELAVTAATQVAKPYPNWRGEVADVFKWLERNTDKFGLVVADPPAFAKVKKDVAVALKGYEKLARLATQAVAPGGLLALASCSHHIDPGPFLEACADGIRAGGRQASLIHTAGAGPDHPVHPQLPQTGYLKFLVFALD